MTKRKTPELGRHAKAGRQIGRLLNRPVTVRLSRRSAEQLLHEADQLVNVVSPRSRAAWVEVAAELRRVL
jgi:hypothetical protein